MRPAGAKWRALSFNSATAVNRGEPSRTADRAFASEPLQFGHGGEPWRTAFAPPSRTRTRGGMLQFGHGGEPWRTRVVVGRPAEPGRLQFGHGGEPWRTVSVWAFAPPSPSMLQFGHGGEPWRTAARAAKELADAEASIRPRR